MYINWFDFVIKLFNNIIELNDWIWFNILNIISISTLSFSLFWSRSLYLHYSIYIIISIINPSTKLKSKFAFRIEIENSIDKIKLAWYNLNTELKFKKELQNSKWKFTNWFGMKARRLGFVHIVELYIKDLTPGNRLRITVWSVRLFGNKSR